MKKLIFAAASVLGAVVMTPAHANVVTIGPSTAQIACQDTDDLTIDCVGMTGGSLTVVMNETTGGTAGSLDNSSPFTADLYDPGKDSEANEIAALNVLAGTSYVEGDAVRTDAGGVSALSFSSLAEWVIIKMGAGTVFIKNVSPGIMALNIDFSQLGSAGGISHYTEVGFSQVPVPGAIWLMGAGLAGLGFAGRKKKAA